MKRKKRLIGSLQILLPLAASIGVGYLIMDSPYHTFAQNLSVAIFALLGTWIFTLIPTLFLTD